MVLWFDSACSAAQEEAKSQRHWVRVQAARHHRTLPDSRILPVPVSASALFPPAALLTAIAVRKTPDSGTKPDQPDRRRSVSNFLARRGRGLRSWSITFPGFSVRGRRRRPWHRTDFHPPVLGPGFCIHIGYCRVVRAEGSGEYPVVKQAQFCQRAGNCKCPLGRKAPVILVTVARVHGQVVGESAHHQQLIVL